MLQTEPAVGGSTSDSAPDDVLLASCRLMLRARLLEDKLGSLFRGGKISGGCYLGRGQEALSAAAGLALRKGDIYSPLIRDQAGRLAFGEPMIDAIRTHLGSSLGPMRGREGNVHRGRPREGYFAMISHLGSMIAPVVGALLARRLKGTPTLPGSDLLAVGLTCIGDGGTSTGSWHEAINLAAVEHVPLILVVANNQYAYSTPNTRQFACEDLADRAKGYGVRGWRVDATDWEACLKTLLAAVADARKGGGPQLVVGNLLRLAGHGEHDDASYVEEHLIGGPLGRDCLEYARATLVQRGLLSQADYCAWTEAAQAEINSAVGTAQREPAPDPYREDWSPLSATHLIESGGQ